MKILIVDDHPIVRKGISSALSFEKDVEKVLEASSLKKAMTLINAEKPELCIVDLYLGEEDGLELLKKAKYESGGVKFVILTSSLKKEDFIRAEEAGADGYILKDAFSEDILYAISVVLRGKKFIDPDIVRCQVETYEKLDCLKELTPREVEVLYELGKGLSNVEIAKRLFITENTVKKHVSNILLKLELCHRIEAALFVNNMQNYHGGRYNEI